MAAFFRLQLWVHWQFELRLISSLLGVHSSNVTNNNSDMVADTCNMQHGNGNVLSVGSPSPIAPN